MNLRLYDAHNHLQDERLAPFLDTILDDLAREGVARMVVNGSSERDWPLVHELARRCSSVIPSFGYHPWYVKERSPGWQSVLVQCLERAPSAMGEVGLDRWVEGCDVEQQEEVFGWQLRLAAERNLPLSIHCLRAWGRLVELLRAGPRPRCGFVLHSFGGARELIEPLAELGAYFSLPGYFAQERKVRQREVFRHVPSERLLIETDAPDQSLPSERVLYPLPDAGPGRPVNHPANLTAVYRFAAELFGEPIEQLAPRVEANFLRLFGSVAGSVA